MMTKATRSALTRNETERTYALDEIKLQDLGVLPTAQALPRAAAYLADLVRDRTFLEFHVLTVLEAAPLPATGQFSNWGRLSRVLFTVAGTTGSPQVEGRA